MSPQLTDGEVRRALEQQRGIGYSMSLPDALIKTMKEEVAFRKDELLDEED